MVPYAASMGLASESGYPREQSEWLTFGVITSTSVRLVCVGVARSYSQSTSQRDACDISRRSRMLPQFSKRDAAIILLRCSGSEVGHDQTPVAGVLSPGAWVELQLSSSQLPPPPLHSYFFDRSQQVGFSATTSVGAFGTGWSYSQEGWVGGTHVYIS